MDYKEIAEQIYTKVGKKNNITDVTHCMTRLRLKLMDYDKADTDAIKKIQGVMGININEAELQIVLGPGRVDNVFSEFTALMDNEASSNNIEAFSSKSGDIKKPSIGDGKELHAQIRAKNATPFKLLTKRIANIFIPMIPGFIACGLLTGILGISFKINPELTSWPIIQLLTVMSNAIFFGLNILVGYNAAKEFGGSPTMGAILAIVLSHPNLANINLMGNNLVPGRGGIIAVLMVAILGALLERYLKKIIPEMFSLFLTPLLVLLIGGLTAIFILQPVGQIIAEGIGMAATTAIQQGGVITGFILGGIWLPLVMLGIHQTMTPIHAQLLSEYGVTILLPILAMAGCGQIGASIAVYVKTKNKFLKKTILSALPVGIMGVGEPLIYGVTLPLGKPFIGACIGGAFGGAVQAAFMVGASAMGISGLPLAATTNNIPVYLVGLVVAYIGGFIATWIIGFDDPEEEEE
ncbi:PTS system, fructose-specific [Anaerovibrio sp. JC8]|uniref:PTS transporter subunit EIIC n=1 Tax=Anaerovibrio sp. JC8 TaxID=1240085 RepID=UPI000A0A8A8C|nr:PTS transporter subunit EIIC [Anaerovibrio sp. JC8]ORU00321.1 PTS system, fructose-specific [Anaerovibrio sp. JC8]